MVPPFFILMEFNTFEEKLKQLNPNLYVGKRNIHYSTSPLGTSGIYIKGGREKLKLELGEGYELYKGIKDYNDCDDRYVAFTQHRWVPTGDDIDAQTKKTRAPGWRSIVKRLVTMNLTTKEKAAKVFGWYESDYDKLDHQGKIEFEAKHA